MEAFQFFASARERQHPRPFAKAAEVGADRHDGSHRQACRGHGERWLTGIVAGAALILAAGTASAAPGNVQAGKRDFGRCAACHSLEKGVNLFGPSLHCIVGRRAGSAPNYPYSKSIRELGAKGVHWNAAHLFGYLNNPRRYLEKQLGKSSIHNKMTMKFHSSNFRNDVIAYLAANACR